MYRPNYDELANESLYDQNNPTTENEYAVYNLKWKLYRGANHLE
jgi:hypothetical protein